MPEAPSPATPVPARPRRRRWIVVASLVAGLVLIAGLVGAGVYAATYRPLAVGCCGNVVLGPSVTAFGPDDPMDPSGQRQFGVRCAVGQHVGLRFMVENEGPFTVTVTGVGHPADPLAAIQFDGALMGRASGSDSQLASPPFRAFAPFSLQPGHVREVVLTAVTRECGDPHAGITIGSANVAFRALGMSRRQELTLPYAVTWSRSGTIRPPSS